MKRALYILILIIGTIVYATEGLKVDDFKEVLGYSENIQVDVEQFISGDTGFFLSAMVVAEKIDQKKFERDTELVPVINDGWTEYSKNNDPFKALKIYLQYYAAVSQKLPTVFNSFCNDPSELFDRDLYFLYLNNLSTFLWALGYVKHAHAINDLLFSYIDMCADSVYKSYIYINRAARKVEEGDFVAATHYFFLAYLNNGDQKKDILSLKDVREEEKKLAYMNSKYFELLKQLLSTYKPGDKPYLKNMVSTDAAEVLKYRYEKFKEFFMKALDIVSGNEKGVRKLRRFLIEYLNGLVYFDDSLQDVEGYTIQTLEGYTIQLLTDKLIKEVLENFKLSHESAQEESMRTTLEQVFHVEKVETFPVEIPEEESKKMPETLINKIQEIRKVILYVGVNYEVEKTLIKIEDYWYYAVMYYDGKRIHLYPSAIFYDLLRNDTNAGSEAPKESTTETPGGFNRKEKEKSEPPEISEKEEINITKDATVILPEFSMTMIKADDFGIPYNLWTFVQTAGKAALYDKMRGPRKSGWDRTRVELFATPNSLVSDTYFYGSPYTNNGALVPPWFEEYVKRTHLGVTASIQFLADGSSFTAGTLTFGESFSYIPLFYILKIRSDNSTFYKAIATKEYMGTTTVKDIEKMYEVLLNTWFDAPNSLTMAVIYAVFDRDEFLQTTTTIISYDYLQRSQPAMRMYVVLKNPGIK